jgi:hypothetical protein
VANLCLAALEQLRAFLLAGDGVNAALAGIGSRDGVHLPTLSEQSVGIQNVLAEFADENLAVVYPAVYLYCDRMDNQQIEKFAKFSGPVFLVADVRVSQEHLTGLDQQLARYVEAVQAVLGAHFGKWTENVAYGGAHRVQFREIKLGGRNFLQTARVEMEVQAHE